MERGGKEGELEAGRRKGALGGGNMQMGSGDNTITPQPTTEYSDLHMKTVATAIKLLIPP